MAGAKTSTPTPAFGGALPRRWGGEKDRILASVPLLPPAAALACGIAAARVSVFFPYSAIIFSLLAASFALSRKEYPLKGRLAAAAFYAAGFLAFFLYGPAAPSYAASLTGKGVVRVTGEVVRPPQEKDGVTVFFLKPDIPPGHGGHRRAGLVRLSLRGTAPGVNYGDVIEAGLKLEKPKGFRNPGTFDWGAYATLNGEDAVARAKPDQVVKAGNRALPALARLYEFRRRLGTMADSSLPPESAALFRSVILGDQGKVSQRMRDDFSASGTTHILSVSGSHVALLTAVVFMLANGLISLLPHRLALRMSMHADPRKIAAAAAIPAAALYCLLAGMEVASVRALVMVAAFLFAIILDRKSALLNSLSAAALAVLLYDPSALFDISFQLSYGSVLFMALAMEAREIRESVRRGLPARVWSRAWLAVIASASVIAGTAPLVAKQFNSFSWVSLPANLIITPLAGVAAVPAGLVSCLLAASGASASGPLPLANLNAFVLGAFYKAVSLFAAFPYANLHPPAPDISTLLLYYFAAGAAFMMRIKNIRAVAAAGACLTVFAASSLFSSLPSRNMEAVFLDVGQGDCAFVRLPDGKTMLIDGGGNPRGIDPGRAAVAPYLWNHGVRRLDCVVVTHPHPDHFGGLFYILENFEVGEVWEGRAGSGGEDFGRLKGLAARKGIPSRIFSTPGQVEYGGASVQILHAGAGPVDDGGRDEYVRENNRSLILRIKYGEVSFLFAGDIQKEAEKEMLLAEPPLPLKSSVLKVPHHGGRSSCLEGFMQAVSPQAAVVSTGRASDERGVSRETEELLSGLGARVFNTSRDGAVTIRTDGKSIEATTYVEKELKPAGHWEEELENYGKI